MDGHARAIVGQPYRQTAVFRAEIDSVVLNPSWTVPPGILAKDVLLALRRGEDVLARKHLRVYDRDGRALPATAIDWSAYTARKLPYVLRQDPGAGNALGRVKIDFPNPYLVYLHDTPTRALFGKVGRTFSSGCIRIDRPLELVERLRANPVRWNAAALRAAVDSGETRTLALPRQVPVLVIYRTAEADADGRVVFKPDVYHRDLRLLRPLDGRFGVSARDRP